MKKILGFVLTLTMLLQTAVMAVPVGVDVFESADTFVEADTNNGESSEPDEYWIELMAMGDYGGNETGATWYWPIHGYSSASSAYSKITSSYGFRGSSYQNYHKGVDIGESKGTSVYSVRSGTVSEINNSISGSAGRYIIINHNDGYYSIYMHLSKINVSKGQSVSKSTIIGAVGGSGYGSESYYGYHLHLGIHYGSSFNWECNVNPCPSGYTRVGNSLQSSNGGYPVGSASISYVINSSNPTYTITYDLDGGTGGPSNTTITGSSYTIPTTVPTKLGYVFWGWKRDGVKTVYSGDTITLTGDTTLKASWTSLGEFGIALQENKCTFLAPYGGYAWRKLWFHSSLCNEEVYMVFESMKETGDPYGALVDSSGNVLISDDDSGDGNNFKFMYKINTSKTYYLRTGFHGTYPSDSSMLINVTPQLYTLNVDPNGGTATDKTSFVLTYMDNYYYDLYYLTRNSYSKSGYHLIGWNTEKDYTGTFYSKNSMLGKYVANGPLEKVTIYAQWEKDHTVSYDANGGTGAPTTQTKTYGKDLTLSKTEPARNGYIFQGWAISPDSNVVSYYSGSLYIPDKSITLYAVWKQAFIGSGTCGSNLKWTLDSDGTLTISGTGDMYDWKTESDPDLPWDEYRNQIKNIVIEEGVTSIGACAFCSCYYVKSIKIPASLTTLGDDIFFGCPNLNKVYINNLSAWCNISFGIGSNPLEVAEELYINNVLTKEIAIPEGVERISTRAFYRCSAINSVTFPSSLKTIGSQAFSVCRINKVVIPSNVERIEEYAFWNSKVDELTISKGVKYIGENAFTRTDISSVVIPESVTNMGNAPFGDCYNLLNIIVNTSNPKYYSDTNGILYSKEENALIQYPFGKSIDTYVVSEHVERIAPMAFSGCYSISNFVGSENLKVIDESAFEWSGIESVELKEGTTSIGKNAFLGCDCLRKIILPKSVTSIGENAFSGDEYDSVEMNVTIYGYTGSYAETYAKDNEISFISLTPKTYTITFNPNGGSGAPASQTKTHDVALTLSSETPTREGYTFLGWSTSAGGSVEYAPGATYLLNNSVTLYAVWEKIPEEPIESKATMTLSDVSGRPGDTVKVAVSLKTDEAINTIGIKDITYDKNVLTFTGFSDYEALTDICALSSFDDSKMAVVAALKNAQVFDGNICSLNFKINETAEECDVSVSAVANIKLDSNTVVTQVVPATVAVNLQLLGDIDLNETVDLNDAILLLQYSMFPELYPIDYKGSVDFTKDGNIDMNDAILLLQYSMFPELYPIE